MDPYIARLFQIESGGNPNAVTGSNRGLGQFGPAEEAQFGLNNQNRTDPNAQAAAVQREQAQYAPILARALGRPSTPGEDYLTHQQGQAGGPALLTAAPGTLAWQAIRPFYKSDAMAQKAISGNLPAGSGLNALTATAPQYSNFWVNKFEGGNGAASPQPSALLSPQSMASAPPPSLPLFGGAPSNDGQNSSSPANPGSFFSGLPADAGQQAPQMPMPMAMAPRPRLDLSPLMAFLQSGQNPYFGSGT